MSGKKEASGRRSVQVEVEVPGSTQSAVARRSAEAIANNRVPFERAGRLSVVMELRQRVTMPATPAVEQELARTNEVSAAWVDRLKQCVRERGDVAASSGGAGPNCPNSP